MIIKRRQRAFTLIELLIVIVIIGILAGLIIWAVRSAVVKARDAQAKNSVRVVQDALEVYMTENPNLRTSDFGLQFPATNTYYELNDTVLKKLVSGSTRLIASEPKDGQNGKVELRIFNSVGYVIQAKSATNASKCWIASVGTSSANNRNNLSASPTTCN